MICHMASFPSGFVERTETLDVGFGLRGDTALAQLRKKGFTVAASLTEYFAGAMGVIGYQSIFVNTALRALLNHVLALCNQQKTGYEKMTVEVCFYCFEVKSTMLNWRDTTGRVMNLVINYLIIP